MRQESLNASGSWLVLMDEKAWGLRTWWFCGREMITFAFVITYSNIITLIYFHFYFLFALPYRERAGR